VHEIWLQQLNEAEGGEGEYLASFFVCDGGGGLVSDFRCRPAWGCWRLGNGSGLWVTNKYVYSPSNARYDELEREYSH